MDRRLEVAIGAAKEAGRIALRYFRTDLRVERKADQSPVTAADRDCERRIAEILNAEFPDYGFLGEELGERGPAETRWIVDPIDGTKSFIRGIPYFATLIALEEAGEITTGVIYAPAVDELFYAQKGRGAFDAHGALHVSEVGSLDAAMLVFGSPGVFRCAGRWGIYERLVDRCARQRGYGDYFGYTFVARGQAEAMVDADLKPWDLGALKVIVEEAGGRFTDFDGNATIYGGTAIASNARVHEAILSVVEDF